MLSYEKYDREFVAFVLLSLYIGGPKTILMFFSFCPPRLRPRSIQKLEGDSKSGILSVFTDEMWSFTDVQGPLPFGLSIHRFNSEE